MVPAQWLGHCGRSVDTQALKGQYHYVHTKGKVSVPHYQYCLTNHPKFSAVKQPFFMFLILWAKNLERTQRDGLSMLHNV